MVVFGSSPSLISWTATQLEAMTTIAINGFGRVGRNVFDLALDNPNISVVAINDPFIDAEYIAYLIKHDSATRRNGKKRSVEVRAGGNSALMGSLGGTAGSPMSSMSSNMGSRHKEPQAIMVDDRIIDVFAFSDPSAVPWAETKAQYVIDCSGVFTTVERASSHLAGGASRVIIAAPSADAPTLIMGANEETFKKSYQIMACGSCTALALAPALKMLQDSVGVKDVVFTAIHAATAQQGVVDGTNAKDYRLGRAATENIVPCSTGAIKTLNKVIPQLNGKVHATAIRVPVSQGSLLDVTVTLDKPTPKANMDALFAQASEDPRYGKIIGVTKDPVVSSDMIGDTHSCIYDQSSSQPIGDDNTRHKLLLWYDNERGYAARLIDLVIMTASEW